MIEKIERWINRMYFKIPFLEDEGHFSKWDLKQLQDIIHGSEETKNVE